jgi:hypothetical protein
MRNMHYKYDHQDAQQTAMQHKPSHQAQIKHIQFILPNFPGIVSTDRGRQKRSRGFFKLHTHQPNAQHTQSGGQGCGEDWASAPGRCGSHKAKLPEALHHRGWGTCPLGDRHFWTPTRSSKLVGCWEGANAGRRPGPDPVRCSAGLAAPAAPTEPPPTP